MPSIILIVSDDMGVAVSNGRSAGITSSNHIRYYTSSQIFPSWPSYICSRYNHLRLILQLPPIILAIMTLDNFFHNKIEKMQLEILEGQAVLRRLEAQRNDYNSRVRLLREELGLLQQPGSYVGEVVKVMGTKKVLVKVHPEGKYGKSHPQPSPCYLVFMTNIRCLQSSTSQNRSTSPNSQLANASPSSQIPTSSKSPSPPPSIPSSP